MKHVYVIRAIFALMIVGCGNAPAFDTRFLAAEDACLAQTVHHTVAADTGSFQPYVLARWRAYAAVDSSLNHAASREDSARFAHRASIYQNAANARDRMTRADLSSDYTERVADAAASGTQCRRAAARTTK